MFTPSPTPSLYNDIAKGNEIVLYNETYPPFITYLECIALVNRINDNSIAHEFNSMISKILTPLRLTKIILFHAYSTYRYDRSGQDLTFMKQTLFDLAQTKLENENVENEITEEETLNISSFPTDMLSYCLRFLNNLSISHYLHL